MTTSLTTYSNAATLSGVIIDDNRNVALPGMPVQLSLDENFDVRFTTQSDSTGQFFFTDIPAGRYILESYGRYPWAPVFATAGDKGYSIQPDTIFDIEVFADDRLSGYVFDMVIEPYVDYFTGVVFSDDDDDGQQGANEFGIHSVVVNAENDIGDFLQSQTDDNGRYELILDAGFNWTISEEQPAGWQDGVELSKPDRPSISVGDDSYSVFTFGGTIFDELNFAERGRYTLKHNVWQLISLPIIAPATQNTVADVFGDDLIGQYGTTWILYQFNAVTGGYDPLTEQSPIVSERGYWIIQVTGSTVDLDWPTNSSVASGDVDMACAGLSARCIKVDMESGAWNLIGPANVNASAIDKWRVTSNAVCQSGCTLTQAKSENLLMDIVYPLVDGEYEMLSMSDHIVPWQGFWLLTLPDPVNPKLQLLIPSGK